MVIIDRSGANKSGIFDAASGPLQDMVASSLEAHNGRLRKWEAEGAVLASKRASLESSLKKARKIGDALASDRGGTRPGRGPARKWKRPGVAGPFASRFWWSRGESNP